MRKILVFIVIAVSAFSLQAQQTKAEKNLGSWYMYYGNHTISDKWSLLTGFEERNYQTFKNYNLVLFNVGVNYKITNKITATISYMYLDIDRSFDADIVPNTIEHRHYEQINFATNYFKLPFSHRVRLEHRHLNTLGTYSQKNRVRYRFKGSIPINKDFYFTASNESFLNFKGDVYTENRLYTAVGLKASKIVSIEVGYLNHYINELHLNRLQLGLFIKTDFRKKNKN